MAQESDVKFCLMWETEQPDLSEPRQSSYFRLLGEEWYLELMLVQYDFETNHCSVRLYRRGGEIAKTLETALPTACHVTAGNQFLCAQQQHTVRKSGDTISAFFIETRDIPSSENSRKWTVHFSLSCIEPLSLQIDDPTSTNQALEVNDKRVHLQWLSDDFSRLLNEGIEPDVTLTCGGQTWRVHRSVLTVRSEVFAAMFRSGMAESRTGAVYIKDLEAPILDSLLKYVYYGMVPHLSSENVSSLYEASDKYALHGLRKACSIWMIRNVSDESCLSFLVTADAHSDADLKEAIVSFIADHYAKIEDEIWSMFTNQHPFLAITVLQRFAPSKEL